MAVIRDAAGSLLARPSRSSAGEGGLGVAFSRIRLPAMRGGAPPQVGPPTPDLLEPGDRLGFERLLLWVRLLFVGVAVLPLLAFGSRAAPYAVLIAAAALGSCGLVWLLARCWPQTLLRFQIGLRLIDCALVSLVLVNYHAFLGDAYYDSA